MMQQKQTLVEHERGVPIAEATDVIVAGSGPAGVAAALAAARSGARTTLLEVNGCLGGVWTSGLLSWVIDSSGKPGIMREIIDELNARGARTLRVEGGTNFSYDVEQMKLLLEQMVVEAGIRVQLHTRVVAAPRGKDGRIEAVLTESKSGRQAWRAGCYVDATGDGDLAALAGCGFDFGRPGKGDYQPMSLLAVVAGVNSAQIEPFIGGGLTEPKARLLAEFQRAGVTPSYTAPTLFMINEGLFTLMSNHEYGISAMDAGQITQATLRARTEVHSLVAALRSLGGPWKNIYIVATAEQIGVREGRRIHGEYMVRLEDLLGGARHEDAICRANFGVDVHATGVGESRDYEFKEKPRVLPYDIPFRALIAKDAPNLLMAGRCISGDFYAHASYRVTGNAVTMGQAAGVAAALAARLGQPVKALAWPEVQAGIEALNRYCAAASAVAVSG